MIIVCNGKFYECVENFLVLPLTELSDHSKIVTIFKSSISVPTIIEDTYKWINLKSKFKWNNETKGEFYNTLANSTKEIEDIKQRIEGGLIKSTGEKIQDLFISAANNSCQVKTSPPDKNWKKRKKSKKWFDNECLELRGKVRKVGREKLKNPESTLLKSKYHEKLKEFKTKCKSKRYNFWQKKMNEIESALNDPKTFWNKWNKVGETDVNPTHPNITGEEWYNHFSTLHKETDNTNANNFGELRDTSDYCREFDQQFSETEFQNVIKNLKNKKAEGYDSILNEMIKHSPPKVLNVLLKYINLCLEKSLISQRWCFDIINTIHKEGNINNPNNYRGICISSVLLKIICSLLNNRLQSFCSKHNIINNNQIGFKPKHRTSDHLLTLKTIVKKYVTIGEKKLFACFVDFKKAFDSVWHEGLFYKMNKIGIGGKTLELIKDIYRKTKCAVKSKNSITSFFDYTKGVRQGCPLSPILFNIYVNDLFEFMNNDNDSDIFLQESEHKVNILMYADDLIILSETKEGLQKQIDKLAKYCSKWRLQINNKKTKVMIFNRGNKMINTNFHTNNTKLENVKTFKYLGFSISAKNCSFLPTIEDLSIKANRVVYALNSKIKLSKLPTKLALKLFSTLISPILLYGSEVWGPFIDFDFEKWDKSKIEQVHTQFVKRILGCNFKTSNIMSRGEVGKRPLLTEIIKRTILYMQDIQKRKDSLAFKAWKFETNNDTLPNFVSFINKFNLRHNDIIEANKYEVKRACHDYYDRFWSVGLQNSPKAISYKTFKSNVKFESYLHQLKNVKHRIALSRFRLSNHTLMIEKGRHMRPQIERNDRKCFHCKDQIENESHFVTTCPLYTLDREKLFQTCRENSVHFETLNVEQKFIFIMSNECPTVTETLARFIFNSLKVRDNAFIASNYS